MTAIARVLAASASLLLAGVGQSQAQGTYPDRPVRIIVPFAPAGPVDVVARLVGGKLTERFGKQFFVENQAGAGGNLGMGNAAKSAPDGHTILFVSSSYVVNPSLYARVPYDPFKDFIPISELVNAPNVLVVRPDSGINSVADLVAQAKANPAKFNYASPGAGTKSHLTGELLKLRAGIEMVHIPFRGAGPAAQAVLSNTTQVGSVALAAAETLIQDGQLRALAVTSEKRWFSLPNVPTMIEAGYPGFISDTFNALFAPAGTPPEIVALLVREARAAFQRPEAREMARKAGFEVVAGTPEQLAARVASEVPAVRELVAKAGIKPE